MAKTVKEVMDDKYPVRVNVNGRYSHQFKLPKSQDQSPTRGRKVASPLDVARKKGAKV